MNYNQNVTQQKKKIFQLIATHPGNVTESMRKRAKQIIEDYLRSPKGMRQFSITIFDLNENRFVFHDSIYNDRFTPQTLYMDLEDRMKFLNEITKPENLVFCLDTLIKSYTCLRSMNYEESKNYRVVYIQWLLEGNQYHPYLHLMFPSHWDEDGNVWKVTTHTKRLLDMNIEEFRLITHDTDIYTEEHDYSRHLLQIKMKDEDKDLLENYVEDCKRKKLSEVLNKSIHTVSNYYTRINTLFKTNNIQTSCLVYCIMELHRTGKMKHDF